MSVEHDRPAGMLTPRRRLHSYVTNQSCSRPLAAGTEADSLAASEQSRRSMDSMRQELQPTALMGQGLHCTAPRGLSQCHMFSHLNPNSPFTMLASAPWDAKIPSAGTQDDPGSYHAVCGHGVQSQSGCMSLIQDDPTSHHSVVHHNMHAQSLYNQECTSRVGGPCGEISHESLSTRANFFRQDTLAAQGTLQLPLTYPIPPSRSDYDASQSLLHSQPPLQSLSELQSQPQLQAHTQGRPFAQSQFLSRQAQGQADTYEYLRRSMTGQSPSWHQLPKAPDLAASPFAEQPPTQSQSETAFYSW